MGSKGHGQGQTFLHHLHWFYGAAGVGELHVDSTANDSSYTYDIFLREIACIAQRRSAEERDGPSPQFCHFIVMSHALSSRSVMISHTTSPSGLFLSILPQSLRLCDHMMLTCVAMKFLNGYPMAIYTLMGPTVYIPSHQAVTG